METSERLNFARRAPGVIAGRAHGSPRKGAGFAFDAGKRLAAQPLVDTGWAGG